MCYQVLDFFKENSGFVDFLKFSIVFVIATFILFWLFFFKIHSIVIYNHKKNENTSEDVSEEILPEMHLSGNQNSSIKLWKQSKKEKIAELNNLKSIINDKNFIFIVGDGGAGKSTLLRYIYNQLYELTHPLILPLFIQIRNLDSGEHPILDYVNKKNYLKGKLNGISGFQYDINNWDSLIRLIRKPFRLYVFIDGYDEIAYSENGFDKIDKEIEGIIKYANANVKLIISSRYKPNLHCDDRFSTLLISNLTQEQQENYIGDKNFENFSAIKDKVTNPLLITMYRKSYGSEGDDYIANIKTSADVFWNYYCYQWKKIYEQQNKNENAKVVFIKYILPFIAYNLEYKNINKFTKEDLIEYVRKFNMNFEYFKSMFSFNCSQNDIKELIENSDFEKHYINEISVIVFDKKYFKFNHLLQKNFYAAVYEYYKDYSILHTDYGKEIVKTYSPYEALDDKVTIHTSTRVFYSNIIARLIENEPIDDFSNKGKYYSILSDLHYYGDSDLIKMDKQKAKDESYEGYLECCIFSKEDKLTKNWLAWNLAFIVFDNLKNEEEGFLYSDKDKNYVIKAFDALKEAQNNNYAPAFDKLALIYTSNLWKQFITNDIFTEGDYIPKNQNDAIDKAKELLNKAKEGNFHFSYNNYGHLLEQEGNINGAFANYESSVKCDPLDFYARSRCALYLLHNYSNIEKYATRPNGQNKAYKDAQKYLNDGYEYFKKIEYDKPYEFKSIYNLMSNLAEYNLLFYYNKDKIQISSDLKSAFEYYKVLFDIRKKECDHYNKDFIASFNKNSMRDLLCYCLVCLILKSEGNKNDNYSVYDIPFDELCAKVKTHFGENTNQVNSIFHFERFDKYYTEFIKLYERSQK